MPFVQIKKAQEHDKKRCFICEKWSSLQDSGKFGRCNDPRIAQVSDLVEEDDVCEFWKSKEEVEGEKWCPTHREYYREEEVSCPMCRGEDMGREADRKIREEEEKPGW